MDTEKAKKKACTMMNQFKEKREAIEGHQQRKEFEEQVRAVTKKGRRVKKKEIEEQSQLKRIRNPKLAGLTAEQRRGITSLKGEEEVEILKRVMGGNIEPEVAELNQVSLNVAGLKEEAGGDGEPPKKKKARSRRMFQGDEAKIYVVPPVPPNRATLTGFKRLLLNRSSLMGKSAHILTERNTKRRKNMNLGKKDLMAPIRQTHDYQMLRSRFHSLFLWPALMSDLPVPREEVTRLCKIKKPLQPTVMPNTAKTKLLFK